MKSWFKKYYSVCDQCQVHFEPATGMESHWGNLCPLHRKPVMDKDLRMKRVLDWAKHNWEKLEVQYLDEVKKTQVVMNDWAQAQSQNINSLFGQSLSGQGLGGLDQKAFRNK